MVTLYRFRVYIDYRGFSVLSFFALEQADNNVKFFRKLYMIQLYIFDSEISLEQQDPFGRLESCPLKSSIFLVKMSNILVTFEQYSI